MPLRLVGVRGFITSHHLFQLTADPAWQDSIILPSKVSLLFRLLTGLEVHTGRGKHVLLCYCLKLFHVPILLKKLSSAGGRSNFLKLMPVLPLEGWCSNIRLQMHTLQQPLSTQEVGLAISLIFVNITLRTHHRGFTLPIQTPDLNWGQLNTKGTDFSRIYMAFQIWSFGFKSFPLCDYSSNSWCKHCLAW